MKNKFINFLFAAVLLVVPCCCTVNVKASGIDKDGLLASGNIPVIEAVDENGIKMGTSDVVTTTCFGYGGESRYGRNKRL